MLKVFYVVIFAFSMNACVTTTHLPRSTNVLENLKLTQLFTTQNGEIEDSSLVLITSLAAFDTFFLAHKAITQMYDKPMIDFANNAVLSVAMGSQTSGGYKIAVEKVEYLKNRLIVTVKETVPSYFCNVTEAFTTPYEMVLVEKSFLNSEVALVKKLVRDTTFCKPR